MADVGVLFELGKGLAATAIKTGGTTVRIETRTEGATLTAPDTVTPVVGPIPALVVPAGDRQATQALPGVDIKVTDWRVILLPDTTPPPVGSWVVVVTSKNPILPGLDAKVLGWVADSSGAVLAVFARPQGGS